MIEILGIICLIIAFFAWNYYRTIINPISLLFFVWGVMILFSSSSKYEIGAIKDQTYVIVFLGLTAFAIGSICGARSRVRVLQFQRFDSSKNDFDFNYRFLYVLMIITLALLFYQSARALSLIRRGYNLAYVRRLMFEYEENEMRSSSLVVVFQKFFIAPSVCLLMCFIPIEIVINRKNGKFQHKALFLGSIACFILNIISSGGRLNIIALAVYFFTCLYFKRIGFMENEELPKKKRNRNGIVILSVILLLYITYRITINRGGETFDFFRHIFIYLGAPIRFLDYNILKIQSTYNSYHAFGLSSFYGFFYLMFYLLRFITGFYPSFLLEVHDLSVTSLQHVVNLGDGIRINAFATMLFQPYLDGGLIGVIIVMLLFGYCSGKAFISANYKSNKYALLFYFMFEYQILFSMVRFWFTQVSHAVWVIFIFFAIVRISSRNNTYH